MKTQLLTSLLMVMLAAVLQSCMIAKFDPSQYFQNHPYQSDKPFHMEDGPSSAPLLSKKGQVVFDINYVSARSLKAAVAISDKVAVQVGVSFIQDQSIKDQKTTGQVFNELDSTVYTGTAYYKLKDQFRNCVFEAAVGKFRKLGYDGRWETFAGIQYGQAENKYTYVVPQTGGYGFLEHRNYIKLYFQNNLGYVTDVTEGSLMLRLAYFHFLNQDFKMDANYPQEPYKMETGHIVLQPSARFGFGGRTLRGFAQYGMNFSITGGSDLSWDKSSFQCGVIFRFRPPVKNKS